MSLKAEMKEELLETVKKYNPQADLDQVAEAYELAYESHDGQMRNSGEPFIIHPFHTALILAELHMDTATIISGLLHDVVEDTDVTLEELIDQFGPDIGHIVDGVTKLTRVKFRSEEEKQAENLRKMILAMANDIRVIVVKLADRLHNMRTLEYMSPAKKIEKAKEVLGIYSPLASRLGISRLQWELEDLALRYMDYDGYYELAEKIRHRRSERESIINNLIENVSQKLEEAGIKSSISGRPKHLYSIYRKIHEKGRQFDEIYDLQAIRILVDTVADCYGALGVIHTLYRPIPGRFKDFIAMPKTNMYQSIHTTVIDEDGEVFEVQIRTYDMHEVAEYGIAAHWRYKQGDESGTSESIDSELTWVRQMLEWQQEQQDPEEYLEGLKVDFFTDEVFVFTPDGDVISLSEGSTPIDFAYNIHTEVGHTCVGAKVNGKIVPLDYKLRNGNIVEIITDDSSGPSLDWLNIIKSSNARSKIRQYFKLLDRDRNAVAGEELLRYEIKKRDYDPDDLLKDEWLNELAEKNHVEDIFNLYAGIGYGNISPKGTTNSLIDNYEGNRVRSDEEILEEARRERDRREGELRSRKTGLGIKVAGEADLYTRVAQCCNPVPGDDIVGYVTRDRGVSVHRKDCINIVNNKDKDRLIDVEWNYNSRASYKGEIEIKSIPREGLLADITNRISDSNLFIDSLKSHIDRDNISTINILLEISDINELNRLMQRLRNIDSVIDVYRVNK